MRGSIETMAPWLTWRPRDAFTPSTTAFSASAWSAMFSVVRTCRPPPNVASSPYFGRSTKSTIQLTKERAASTWSYDPATNSVIFNSAPASGATIDVSYTKACGS